MNNNLPNYIDRVIGEETLENSYSLDIEKKVAYVPSMTESLSDSKYEGKRLRVKRVIYQNQ